MSIAYTVLNLSSSDVKAALGPADAEETLRAAYAAAGTARLLPLRTNLALPDGHTLYMPGATGNVTGLKVVSVRPGNAERGIATLPATILLLDSATGLPRALLNASDLTPLRTAALSALATRLVGPKAPRSLAILGTGRQGRAHLEAMFALTSSWEEVALWNRSHASNTFSAQELAKEMTKRYPSVRFTAFASADEAVQRSQVICACTNSSIPVFSDASVQAGAHLNCIGSYTPEMVEVPHETVARSRVIADQTEHVWAEAGDLLVPLSRGLITKEHILAQLEDLVAHPDLLKHVRRNDTDITLYKSTGNALQDLIVAQGVLDRATKLGLGVKVNL